MTDTNTTTQLEISNPKPRKKLLKIVLGTIFGCIAFLVVLVVFLPTIASLPMFRGLITDVVAGQVNGKVTIGDMSLAWFGPQQLDNFSIVGNDGKSSLTVSASLRNGLVDLGTGSVDQIDVTLSAKVVGAVDANGKLDLLDLAKQEKLTFQFN